MKISKSAWSEYVHKAFLCGEKASQEMDAWITKHGMSDEEGLIYEAFRIITKYGSANGALACEMYDKIAEASNVVVPSAEMADLPTTEKVKSQVSYALGISDRILTPTIVKCVKQVGADTMLKNAYRDGAQYAFIPQGSETCAFCITLASNGWRNATKNTQAEHIHANCDCQYCVRFHLSDTVECYEPQKYLDMYNNADPNGTPQSKVNALRRQFREQNKDKINARKRELYKLNKESNQTD